MKSVTKALAFVVVMAVSIIACKKDAKDAAVNEISDETIARISQLGLVLPVYKKLKRVTWLKEISSSPMLC